MFRPGTSLPVFPTRYGPIGVQICYDFWFNPELTRILALKGARLVVNCCATFQGEGKRDYMVHTTCTRAAGEPHLHGERQPPRRPRTTRTTPPSISTTRAPPTTSGTAPSPGPAFPRFSHVYAEAGDTEEIVSATLSFEKLHRWQSMFPMRDWRAGRQLDASQLDRRRVREARQPLSAVHRPSMCQSGVTETPRTTLGPGCGRLGRGWGAVSTSSSRLTASSSRSISSLERPSRSRSRSRA